MYYPVKPPLQLLPPTITAPYLTTIVPKTMFGASAALVTKTMTTSPILLVLPSTADPTAMILTVVRPKIYIVPPPIAVADTVTTTLTIMCLKMTPIIPPTIVDTMTTVQLPRESEFSVTGLHLYMNFSTRNTSGLHRSPGPGGYTTTIWDHPHPSFLYAPLGLPLSFSGGGDRGGGGILSTHTPVYSEFSMSHPPSFFPPHHQHRPCPSLSTPLSSLVTKLSLFHSDPPLYLLNHTTKTSHLDFSISCIPISATNLVCSK